MRNSENFVRLSTLLVSVLVFGSPSAALELQESRTCFLLLLAHTGNGEDPVTDPTSSPGCQFHEYQEGEVIALTAQPDPGWELTAWTGTDDDASTLPTNVVTMPAAHHPLQADYSPLCLSLSLAHAGNGADPVATALGNGESWTKHHVASQCDALGLGAADIDGDGDLDALAGLSDVSREAVWWENLAGDATAWTSHMIAGDLDWPTAVDAADFDADGDIDVVAGMAVDNRVLWFRNSDGQGTAWVQELIADPVPGVDDVVAFDLDQDGDPDVLGAAANSHRFLWWENVDDGASWVEHTVAIGLDGANSVAAADFDGDGDFDLAGVTNTSDEVAWFENLGDETSWTTHILQGAQNDFEFPLEVVAADLNGDGQPDIMATALLGEVIRWWENLGGASAFLAHDVDELDRAGGARVADLDRDGDLDVVGQAQEILSWHNRNGSGLAWEQITVEDPYINTGDVLPGDFDGDGDVDVLGSQEVPCSVDVFLNTYQAICPAGTFQPRDRFQVVANPAAGWQVAGWIGTDNDASTELTNLVTLPLVDHEVTVLYQEIDTFELNAVISGSCPGLVTLAISGAAPNARIALFAGNDGSSTLEQGPCSGTELDLGASRLLATDRADGAGDLSFDRTVGANFCSRSLQALDTSTCGVSNPVEVP